MRASGDILLISCYELGHQPFQLASLATMLRQAGYVATPIDTSVETLTDEAIKNARFIAVSVPMHTALRLGEQLALRVRSLNPSAHICFYGLYALLNADHLLLGTNPSRQRRSVAAEPSQLANDASASTASQSGKLQGIVSHSGGMQGNGSIDSAVGGEYEEPLLKLIAALERGETIQIPGVSTRESISGPWVQRTAFVVPDRQQLPALDRYARLELNGQTLLAGYTETTRGCKHTCLHCPITPIYHGRFFAVPAEIVLADIRIQVAQGARHITFGDPDFFNGPTHAMRIVRALHQEFPEVTFDATIKIEHLLKHRRLLPELEECGCAFVVSAVESLNDTVLQHLDKGHTCADVAEAFDLMESVGITLRPSLMPFSPWETLESYIELLDFFEERRLVEHIDPVHFSIRLLIPPGSALLDIQTSNAARSRLRFASAGLKGGLDIQTSNAARSGASLSDELSEAQASHSDEPKASCDSSVSECSKTSCDSSVARRNKIRFASAGLKGSLDAPGIYAWLGELDPTSYTYRWRHPDPRMDDLQRKVAVVVEEAQRNQADPIEIFFNIKALSLAANGQDMSVSRAIEDYGTGKVLPHLTESWFC